MDNLIEIEKQRTELEVNINKLRKALNHWRTLELDYEGLKDEINQLPLDVSKSDYLNLARDFGPQKLDAKELEELFEPKKGAVRSPKQLVDVLANRIDYVRRNVSSLKSQIEKLEQQTEKILADDSDLQGDELPVTEITEELDEDGNVLSSQLQPQGDSASKVIDILKQVEVKTEGKLSATGTPDAAKVSTQKQSDSESLSPELLILAPPTNEIATQGSVGDDESDVFSLNQDDTEEEAELRKEMLQYGLEEVGNIVAELELEDEDGFASRGSEDIDELSDEINEDSDISDLDQSSEEEDEDDSGRARQSSHSDAYRKRMEDLQKRLGVSLENVGPSPASDEVSEHIEIPTATDAQQYIERLPPTMRKRIERPSAKEAARSAAIAREEALRIANKDAKPAIGSKKKSRSDKKVSFASELDIATDNVKKEAISPAVTSEEVVERDTSTMATPDIVKQPTKVSRFRSARTTQTSKPSILKATTPVPEENDSQSIPPKSVRTHADVLVERPISVKTPVAPEADDFDEELQQRQIAMEHHKLKNRLVHNQGGYVQGGELDNWGDEMVAPEVLDERTGESKKISRFKAARLKS